MKIKDIMIFDVVSVPSDFSISEVADIIFSNRFHGVPVVDKDNKVVGIITEDDFFLKDYDDLFLPTYIKFLEKNRDARHLPKEIKQKIRTLTGSRARDIMTEDCLTVSPEMNTEELMSLVKKTKFTTFPVAKEDKTLLGIVTLSDILGIVKKGSEEMLESLKQPNKKENLHKLTSELNGFWQDKVVIVSRKRVQTWKGIAFLGLIALILLAISLVIIAKSQTGYSQEGDSTPLECQKYIYGPWSSCNEKGYKTREITERFPKNCSGGTIPEQMQRCQ